MLGIVAVIGSIYAFISISCGVISILLHKKVKRQIVEREVSPSSESLAKVGMFCGIVGIVLGGVGILFLLFRASLEITF